MSSSIEVMSNESSYSYTPKGLVASYERLKADEWFHRAISDANMMKTEKADDEENRNVDNVDVDVEDAESDTPMTAEVPITNAGVAATNGNKATGSNANDARIVTVAAVQITGADLPVSDVAGYCFRAEQAIEQAAAAGATLIVLPELWSGPYFCQTIENDYFLLADPIEEDGSSNILIKRMQLLAKLHNVVLPVSIFERFNNVYYNSVVMIDSDGSIVGIYRKSHIPDAIGYQEKFYFTPGDTGFQVFTTSVGKIGVGICWDQWFPETARCLVLQGAEILVYPTAIGNEPEMPDWDTSDHWQRVMQGHSAANFVPVIASNRYGTEILLKNYEDTIDDDNIGSSSNTNSNERQRMKFYGRSFITDGTGAIIREVTKQTGPVEIITAELNLQHNNYQRTIFGCFRDRRPDLYGAILTKDGSTKRPFYASK